LIEDYVAYYLYSFDVLSCAERSLSCSDIISSRKPECHSLWWRYGCSWHNQVHSWPRQQFA